MPRITQECAARIKDSADIVELIGRYIQLRRAGNAWKACCPFHSEKTPSFSVNPARQSFHCFGCGVGGDALKFLMMFENIDYPTALRRLADMNGIPVIEEEDNPELARRRLLRARVIEVNRLAADYFHSLLCRSQEAAHVRAYLQKRGFGIAIAKAWQLGWAPPTSAGFRQMAAAKHMDERLLTEAYLLGQSPRGTYPVFKDRLMFPIHNVRGEIVGFSGRIMEEGQDPRKYVNTSDTVAFHKGELLFGLYKATGPIGKAGMCVVICEGQLDVIACHEKADIRNAVAGLGTAFTDEHAAILRKYAKKAILCYDGDNAGIKASEKTYRKLAQAGLEVCQASLPPGEDPDSLIRTQGAEALRQAIENARPYLEVRVGLELAQIQGDAAARAALIPRMADLAADIADPARRDIAVVDLATRLNTGLEDLRSTVNEILRARRDSPPYQQVQHPDRESPAYPGEDDMESETSTASPAAILPPIRLHPRIRGLIAMAATNARVQQILVDRIEDLHECMQVLSGGIVLQRYLEKLPQPGDARAWETFLAELPPEQAAALKGISPAPQEIPDVEKHVGEALERASRETVEARIDTLMAKLHGGNLSPEDALDTMQKVTELRELFKS